MRVVGTSWRSLEPDERAGRGSRHDDEEGTMNRDSLDVVELSLKIDGNAHVEADPRGGEVYAQDAHDVAVELGGGLGSPCSRTMGIGDAQYIPE